MPVPYIVIIAYTLLGKQAFQAIFGRVRLTGFNGGLTPYPYKPVGFDEKIKFLKKKYSEYFK